MAGLVVGASRQAAAVAASTGNNVTGRRPLRLLILGGTGFLGPQVVDAARRRGAGVTLFNRGRTNPGLFLNTQGVEQIFGDRQTSLLPLRGRTWDVVLDTSAHVPRLAREAASFLRGAVSAYVYVSSTAVYRDLDRPIDEASAIQPWPSGADVRSERVTDVTYGPMKALCEDEVRRVFEQRALIIRPGHIVGPKDPTDRLSYWVARTARGGDCIAPGRPTDPVQLIDVRDLAEWIVDAAARSLGGTYNAVGPRSPLTLEQLLKTCQSAVGGKPHWLWAGADLLRQLGALGKLPLWLPPEQLGLSRVSTQRAVQNGLRHRPLTATVRDTWAWFRSLPRDRRDALHAGLSPLEESQLLTSLRRLQAQR